MNKISFKKSEYNTNLDKVKNSNFLISISNINQIRTKTGF